MMNRTVIRLLALSLTGIAGSPIVHAAEPLHPIANPSLYEQRGVVGNVDTATGSLTIGGKRYRANAKTAIFISDGQGRLHKGKTIADIPANSPVSFAAGADGTVTQILVGSDMTAASP